MRATIIVAVIVLVVIECWAKLCPKGEFWSSKQDRCLTCTKCRHNKVTLRPCQQHRDTICGNISELDWSWMPREKHYATDRGTEKVQFDDDDDDHIPTKSSTFHRGSIDANILNNYGSVLRGDDTRRTTAEEQKPHHNKLKMTTPRALYRRPKVIIDDATTHEEKVHWNDEFFDPEKLLEDLGGGGTEGKTRKNFMKFEDEKQLERWLIRSQNKLKHKKDDLMKNLKEKKVEEVGGGGLRLNHPTATIVDDPHLLQRLLDHEMHTNKTKLRKEEHHRTRGRISELEKLEKELQKEELSAGNVNLIDLVDTKSKSKASELEFKSAAPTHRMANNPHDPNRQQVMKGGMVFEKTTFISVSNLTTDYGKKSVTAAPFSAAERIVWDWQAVAFVSAVASCLLFFLAAAIYTIVNARQWRRIKKRYDTDLDEMSSRLALMGGIGQSTGSECTTAESATIDAAVNKGKYLQQLIAAQNFSERKSNLYIDDKLNS